jgi:endonuclease YncB( thermonuclease family)
LIYIYKAELIRVIDGDTVELIIDLGFDTQRKERFRLYGIDAPEMRTAAGKEAKAWLREVLQPLEAIYVQTIQLATKAKRDKYGRFLAVLFDDTSDMQASGPTKTRVCPSSINARMIVEGHAKERYW